MPENQTGETPRAARYDRVSTGGQDEISTSDPLEAARDYTAKSGLEPMKEYSDTDGSRDQFEQMMADATQENPAFQQILVYDLRQFSRSAQEFHEQRARLEANGVSLRSVMEHD